jgi:hypothetical protein
MHEFINEDHYAIMHLLEKSQQIIDLRKREVANAGTNECVRINDWQRVYKELEEAITLLNNQIKKGE